MTGAELIKWIQEHHAEDKLIAFDASSYETELVEISEPELYHVPDFDTWTDRNLLGKEIIRIV